MSIYDKKYHYVLFLSADEIKFYEFKEQIEKQIKSYGLKIKIFSFDKGILKNEK